MKTIPLTQGKFALVDDGDFELLSKYTWHAHKKRHVFYAGTCLKRNGKWFRTSMHQIILNFPKGVLCDHKNRNGLDNRRQNLRIATPSQNNGNSEIPKNNSSGFKGIGWKEKLKKWQAKISINNNAKYLGVFKTKKAAAAAYDEAAIKYRGEFALTNKMLGLL